MEFKRYTEKTLEEALKSAARDKGVSVEDLHYNVLLRLRLIVKKM